MQLIPSPITTPQDADRSGNASQSPHKTNRFPGMFPGQTFLAILIKWSTAMSNESSGHRIPAIAGVTPSSSARRLSPG